MHKVFLVPRAATGQEHARLKHIIHVYQLTRRLREKVGIARLSYCMLSVAPVMYSRFLHVRRIEGSNIEDEDA
jgi:hypothetical protein